MIRNMGFLDKVIRLLLTAVIIGLLAFDLVSGGIRILLLIIAIALAGTSILGTCPLYLPFKIDTHINHHKA